MTTTHSVADLIGKDPSIVPLSLQRIAQASEEGERIWIGPQDAAKLTAEEVEMYNYAHQVLMYLCIQAPTKHKSGHPGGSLSAFTFAYEVTRRRNPATDQPLRFSAGHLSLLAYHLEWLFGRDGTDVRLSSPQTIIDTFRVIGGLPGHVEAGVGDIPFGTGPLGKGLSNALGVAFGQQYLGKTGAVDILLADGDSQEGQVLEAMRLASHLHLDQLVVHGDWNDIQLSGIPSKTMATDMASVAASMGWSVIEVQNGNDYAQVRAALDKADSMRGNGHPIFICYYTTMGYGVPLMEEGSNKGTKNFHGTPLTKEEGELALSSLKLAPLEDIAKKLEPMRLSFKKKFDAARAKREKAVLDFKLPAGYKRTITEKAGAARKDFGAVHLKALMAGDKRIVVLHADLAESGGFGVVEKEFPNRVINVGVAEANMYMMAAGMRQAGLLPVTYTFAAFGTNEARANARLIDVNTGHIPLGVLHDCTHAGLSVGEDGETHQDRNYVNIPFDHTEIWVAGDSNQAGAMAEKAMATIAKGTESIYVFSSRSNHPQLLDASDKAVYGPEYEFDGRATIVRGHGDQRDSATIISYGAALHEAVAAADILAGEQRIVRVLNAACIRPLDSSAIIQAALETQHLIVCEDHNTEGGLATQIADLIADLCLPCTLRRIGARHYFPSGPSEQLTILAGLDAENIANIVEDQFSLRLAQGEEIFVAFLYGLKERLPHTRFAARAATYIQRLSQDTKYFATLREMWKIKSLPPSDLPTVDALMATLSDMSVPDVNPLTGIDRESQHDNGII